MEYLNRRARFSPHPPGGHPAGGVSIRGAGLPAGLPISEGPGRRIEGRGDHDPAMRSAAPVMERRDLWACLWWLGPMTQPW